MTRFTVNNQPVEYRIDPATPLLWALRDASNLTGTKFGCGTGQCGACTVDVDGQARRSCRVPIGTIEGSYVTTIEGLSRERSHAVQLAFIAESVPQCGFCIPGMIMAASVLLKKNAAPSEELIRASITNLCRCGIYPRLVEAIQRAGRATRGEEIIPAGARPGIDPGDAARVVPALVAPKLSDR
ncbi:(2Fe-2S)-binding protein [Sphingomonas sp. PB2P19]|uniref:(2Fe-2S)-binding protein n=1 Tax=Sphingomonas rhamnosi TaxID=3096156 RepID=UPI002FC74182